jgi:probable rRNA maturation factor
LRAFLTELVKRLSGRQAVTCLITTDAELRRLNRQFRGKNYATDVLSFPPDEMAISLDRAAAQAKDLGHSLDAELRILMLHGALHLRGMDHENDSGQMRRAEIRWRKRLGLPAGLIERAQ